MRNGLAIANNSAYLEENYVRWKQDPHSVPADLARFFEGFDFAQSLDGGIVGKQAQSKVNSLVFHYRTVGHRVARINPLDETEGTIPELQLETYGLADTDLDSPFDTNHIAGVQQARLGDIIGHMRDTYCGVIGVEYMHIQEKAERRWLQERMESNRNTPHLTRDQRVRILRKLQEAHGLEHFLQANYKGQKRFSLEGAETLIPAIDLLVDRAATTGVSEIVFGMAHRGRLNVISNIFQKPLTAVFAEFEDNYEADVYGGDGDVKYHKGYSSDITTASGRAIHVSLTPNASHLEAVDPIVEGRVRAKQAAQGDAERRRVIPFIIHGDAAFAGQGIVAETFNFSQLKGYRTGGTIHFVVNNQVGFTTSPSDYRSGTYATDVAKMCAVPIFHVNGDYPEHVLHVMGIAFDYRQTFGKDVVVEMWCYRVHGHSEADEPSFTQPLLYQQIGNHTPVDDLYRRELVAKGDLSDSEADAMASGHVSQLEEARRQVTSTPVALAAVDTGMAGKWKDLRRAYSHEAVETGVPVETLRDIARRVAAFPAEFTPHRKVRKHYDDFLKKVESGGPLQWAEAEILAFGSLLLEGTGVRLSGEDSRRGTFSQRHAAVFDQKTSEMYIPLANLNPQQGQFCVYDSSLAEASVLAFDYGYSLDDPYRLILWEAQFGDFANGAQVIIDQFIANSQSKWGRMSGLVMLLPHGYEGQGPEHSNGWLSRYIRLCAEDNVQVCNATTPAQYFHALRRQIRRDFRRPLVLLTPKSMLRDPRAVSSLSDLATGHFHEVIDDEHGTPSPRRVLFCSGKIYHELNSRREELGIDDVAIVRVEQFYPINDDLMEEITGKYLGVPEWVWVSEEPTNFGAWAFMNANLSTFVDPDTHIWYAGRARSASPATGSLALHKRQQQRILDFALQKEPLEPVLAEGVAVFKVGEELWHLKSGSRPSGNR
jgi:2-oxoglutarate dehydrogenase E1 component